MIPDIIAMAGTQLNVVDKQLVVYAQELVACARQAIGLLTIVTICQVFSVFRHFVLDIRNSNKAA